MIDYQWWHDCYYCLYFELMFFLSLKPEERCVIHFRKLFFFFFCLVDENSSIVALSFAWESTSYFLEKTLKSVFFLLQWSVEKGQTAPHWPSMTRKSIASPATVKSTDQRDTAMVREQEHSIWTAVRGWASNLKSKCFQFSLFNKFIRITSIVCIPWCVQYYLYAYVSQCFGSYNCV